MSLMPAVFSSDFQRRTRRPEEEDRLFTPLSRAYHFLRDVRFQLRYGELSRAPLRVLRFQFVGGGVVECDWMARTPDPWDGDLPRAIQRRHALLQTLKDALSIRVLLFDAFPDAESANVQVFRESADYMREVILAGCLLRGDHSARGEHSIVMRAKILGFRFRIEGDTLCKL
jgi:hypothetical protein